MKQDTVEPQDQADHDLGIEIIRVLGLKRIRGTGRIETTHGDKNPCGLARTLRHLSASSLEKHAGELLESQKILLQIAKLYSGDREPGSIREKQINQAISVIEKANGIES